MSMRSVRLTPWLALDFNLRRSVVGHDLELSVKVEEKVLQGNKREHQRAVRKMASSIKRLTTRPLHMVNIHPKQAEPHHQRPYPSD